MQSLVHKENYADIIYLSLDTHKDCFGNVFMVLLMMIYGNYLGSGLNNFVATLNTFGLYISEKEVCNPIRPKTQVPLSKVMMLDTI